MSKNVVINAPVAKVSQYLGDLRNAPHYISDIRAVEAISTPSGQVGQPEQGTLVTYRMSFAGNEITLPMRLTKYQAGPPSYLRLDNHEQQITIELRVDEHGQQAQVQVALSAAVAGFMLNMMFGSSLERGLQHLKQLLEG